MRTKSGHVWIRARRRKFLSEVSRTPRSVYAGTMRLKSRVRRERICSTAADNLDDDQSAHIIVEGAKGAAGSAGRV